MFLVTKDLLRRNAALEQQVTDLRVDLARAHAHLDWLSQHVSALTTERAILFDRVLNIQIPALTVARETVAPSPPSDAVAPPLTPELLRALPPVYTRPVGVPKHDAEPEANPAIFEDIGDERASQLGATWDPDGKLVFTK
jgi:hypothetical protein